MILILYVGYWIFHCIHCIHCIIHFTQTIKSHLRIYYALWTMDYEPSDAFEFWVLCEGNVYGVYKIQQFIYYIICCFTISICTTAYNCITILSHIYYTLCIGALSATTLDWIEWPNGEQVNRFPKNLAKLFSLNDD